MRRICLSCLVTYGKKKKLHINKWELLITQYKVQNHYVQRNGSSTMI